MDDDVDFDAYWPSMEERGGYSGPLQDYPTCAVPWCDGVPELNSVYCWAHHCEFELGGEG